jgi:hypothetical protein
MVVAAERGASARSQATFSELLDAWFEHARRDFSPKTVLEMKRARRACTQWIEAGRPYAAPTAKRRAASHVAVRLGPKGEGYNRVVLNLG